MPDHQTPPGATAHSTSEIFRRLGPAGYLAVAWAALPALGGILLMANITTIADWLTTHRELGLGLYILIFILSAGFGFLPTYAQAILGGWTFGPFIGFPAALAGFVGASFVGYLAARFVSEDRVERLIVENTKARAARNALIGRGFWPSLGVVSLLRLPPNSPFAITNLVLASTGVSKRVYLIGTALGMAPRTAIAVYIASRVQDLTDKSQTRPVAATIAGIVASVVVFAILYWIANRAIRRITSAETPDRTPGTDPQPPNR